MAAFTELRFSRRHAAIIRPSRPARTDLRIHPHDGEVATSRLAEWLRPEIVYSVGKPSRWQLHDHARALRSIGAVKVRKMGRQRCHGWMSERRAQQCLLLLHKPAPMWRAVKGGPRGFGKVQWGRYGHRDATMILIGYRHGLRATELCDLQWSQVELNAGRLHVRRAKNGSPSVHPLQGDEIRALRRLQREQRASSHVFCSERGGPMTPKGFNTLIHRIGERARMPFPVHPHMLRHACGYALANAGHDTRALQAWLGHKNIQHTVRYTELAPDRFKNFWR